MKTTASKIAIVTMQIWGVALTLLTAYAIVFTVFKILTGPIPGTASFTF